MTDAKKILDFAAYAFDPVRQYDFLYGKNSDNYRVHKFIQGTHLAPFSILSGIKVSKMEDEEQLRYIADFARNTGVNPSTWKYPIRMGYYGNAGGLGASYGSGLKSIMNLYKTPKSRKNKRYYR